MKNASGLTDRCHRLHESEEYSDCKIICGQYQFNVHKLVLASQSEYFKTAFKKDSFKANMLHTFSSGGSVH